jgi:hypothetical protein
MRLIRAHLLPVQQIAPCAPLAIERTDLDSDPVAGIGKRLESTGRLVPGRDLPGEPVRLFEGNRSPAQRGYRGCFIRCGCPRPRNGRRCVSMPAMSRGRAPARCRHGHESVQDDRIGVAGMARSKPVVDGFGGGSWLAPARGPAWRGARGALSGPHRQATANRPGEPHPRTIRPATVPLPQWHRQARRHAGSPAGRTRAPHLP